MNDEKLKAIQAFRLVDDTFAMVALNKEAIEFILRIFLENDFVQLDDLKKEYVIKDLQGRDIRLDFLAKQGKKLYFNLELQFYREGAAEERAQYHANAISTQFSNHGDKWEELPSVIVVFLVNFDLFKNKQLIYTFDPYAKECIDVDENGQIVTPVKLEGRTIVYVNTSAHEDENSERGKLVHDLLCSDPDEMYFDILRACVYKYKRTKEGTKTMCEIMDNYVRESNKIAKAEATYETSVNIAKNMLQNGISSDIVMKCSNLTQETVLKLQNELTLA